MIAFVFTDRSKICHFINDEFDPYVSADIELYGRSAGVVISRSPTIRPYCDGSWDCYCLLSCNPSYSPTRDLWPRTLYADER